MGVDPNAEKYERFTAEPRPDRYAGKVQNACYGLPAELIARVCQVDVATARRWKSGKSRIPYCACMTLERDLALFGKEWAGWRIQGENICSPDGWVINRNHALSVPLQEQRIKGLEKKLEKQRAEFDRIKEGLLKQLRKYHSWQDKDEQPAPPDELPQLPVFKA